MVAAGARTVNLPDTVGFSVPDEYGALIGRIAKALGDSAIVSVHCHDDLGLAVANSIAAVQAGARQIECTINGIGERAGNCSLEEVVMAFKTRPDRLPYQTGIVTEASLSGQPVADELISFRAATKQSHCRRERLCARGRHPSGRLPEGTHHLRDHRSEVGRCSRRQAGPRQAQRPSRAEGSAARSWVRPQKKKSTPFTCALPPGGSKEGPDGRGDRRPRSRSLTRIWLRTNGRRLTNMDLNVLILPGDGIGTEVTREAVRVLEHVCRKFGHKLNLTRGLLGGIAIHKTGSPFPEETAKLALEADATLMGAVGLPEFDNAPPEQRPEKGLLGIRKTLGVYANLRPVRAYAALIESSPLKNELVEGTDMIIVRELTGGLYYGTPRGISGVRRRRARRSTL